MIDPYFDYVELSKKYPPWRRSRVPAMIVYAILLACILFVIGAAAHYSR
jgi:hypothetical protein